MDGIWLLAVVGLVAVMHRFGGHGEDKGSARGEEGEKEPAPRPEEPSARAG